MRYKLQTPLGPGHTGNRLLVSTLAAAGLQGQLKICPTLANGAEGTQGAS